MADKGPAADKGGNVRVVVRFRPQSESELVHGGVMISHFEPTGRSVTIDGQRKAAFTFDRVFGPDSVQEELYNFSAKPVVEDVLKGYNGTIFAYGQTSSGKTHTMEGPSIDGPERGIIPRIVQNIFQYIEMAPETLEFTVRVSYFEIYMEKIRDLLCDGNDNLQIHENRERGVYVRHATELFMRDTEEVMEVMRSGADRRSVASTNMNDISSRSHSVFQMEITQKDTVKGGVKSGRLYLVDLAGSEKVSKTGADGEVLEEAKNINKSLSALGLVIMSLTDGQPRHHVPYRDSKLTRILQESLGGNSRTTIVICCSPSSYNEQETFSSLRFGKRAKAIKNNAVVNVQYSAEELQKQLDVAKKDLKRMAKLLAAAEAELQLWRSGQTVSEADRIALSDAAGAEVAQQAAALESGEQPGGPQGSALGEQEREDFLKRETELLDMLDDKDEQVRTLEREIEILSKDKVVITTLASENSSLRSKVKELEEQNDEFLAETTEYEVTIEDMARANQELQELTERFKKDKEVVESALKEQMEQFERTVASVSDNINQIFTAKPGVPARTDGSTIVDAHLTKARAFVSNLQNELVQARKQRQELEEEATAQKAAEQKLENDMKELRAAISQAERKAEEAVERLAATTQKYEDTRAAKATLEAQLAELTDNLGGLQNELQQTKRDAGSQEEAKSAELRAVLERQKEQQRQQHVEQLATLQKQLEDLQTEKFALLAEKDRLSLEVAELKSDLEKKSAELSVKSEKLDTHEKKVQQEEKVRQETQVLAEQTTRQLDNCESLKAKMRETLLSRLKGMGSLGAAGGSTGALTDKTPATSAYVTSLEKTVKDLQSTLQEVQKNLAASQREAVSGEKHLQAKAERIKNLEALLKGSEERFQRFIDNQQQVAESRKSAERSQSRNVVRKKSSKAPGQQPITVMRSSKPDVTDQSKSEFWKEQGGSASARPSVSGGRNIVNQGAPLVGQYASPAQPAKPANPLMSVEFV